MASRGGTLRRSGRVGAAAAGLALAFLAACAAFLAACAPGRGVWRDGRLVDAALGASLGDLAALEPGWAPERTPDATLAYRHADGSRASWLRDCRSVKANPKALGRALWIALPGGTIEEAGVREIAGLPAWEHVGRAQDGERGLRVATIARVASRCEDYWLLVVPHVELHHRGAFERWAEGLVEAGRAP